MQAATDIKKQINTPILLLVFNRPDTTAKVFGAIRNAKPRRLYIAADGPRLWKKGEAEEIAKVREISTAVDWPCEVKILFRNENLGCKNAVSDGISWFFKQEQEGIILEDDCLPHQDFFTYCEILLDYYRHDARVSVIAGSNFEKDYMPNGASYHFSKYFDPWGWATWRRTWTCYDGQISFWPKWNKSADWNNKLPNKVEQKYWKKIFDLTYANKLDTWDYSFIACILAKGGLIARSNVNLVSNIGYGKKATHTTYEDSKHSNRTVQGTIGKKLKHPKKVAQEESKDFKMFYNRFDDPNLRMPWLMLNLPMRIVRYIFRTFKSILKL